MKNINKIVEGKYSSYRIVDVLEHGGMSIIYDAISKKDNKSYAIKLLNVQQSENEEARKRLAKEGMIHLYLNHPAFCKVYDYCFVDNRPGMVMEKLNGQSLAHILQMIKVMPIGDALAILREVTTALDFAHNIGKYLPESKMNRILHRDIKPENIFITQNGEVKLLDFGVSSIEGENEIKYPTTVGMTQYYYCPDLFDKYQNYQSDNYRCQHDLYILGLVFYELITGQKALSFQGAFQAGKISSPSKYINCPQSLTRLINTWLSPKPSKRFFEAKQLLEQIDVELKKTTSTNLGKYVTQSSEHDTFKSNDTIAKTIINNKIKLEIAESFFHSWLLIFTIRISRINQERETVQALINEYGKKLCDTHSISCTKAIISVDDLANLLFSLSCKGLNVSRYDFDTLFDQLEDFKQLVLYFGHSSSSRLFYNALKDLSETLEVSYSKRLKILSSYRILFNIIPKSLFETNKPKRKEIDNIFCHLMSRTQTYDRNCPDHEGERNAYLYFLWKMAHCDGDICRKERELISSVSKTFGDISINKNLIVEKKIEDIFKQISEENRLHSFGLLIRTALADEAIAPEELSLMERFAKMIKENQSKEFPDYEMTNFIAELLNAEILLHPLLEKLSTLFSILQFPQNYIRMAIFRIYLLNNLLKPTALKNNELLEYYISIFANKKTPRNEIAEREEKENCLFELSTFMTNHLFSNEKETWATDWISGKKRIRALVPMNLKNQVIALKGFIVEIMKRCVKDESLFIKIDLENNKIIERFIRDFSISGTALIQAGNEIYLDYHYKIKIDGLHI